MSEEFAPLYISGAVRCVDLWARAYAIDMVYWSGTTHTIMGFSSRKDAQEAVRERLTWARD